VDSPKQIPLSAPDCDNLVDSVVWLQSINNTVTVSDSVAQVNNTDRQRCDGGNTMTSGGTRATVNVGTHPFGRSAL